jgi:F-type H+-transporting ATPase subunit b
VGQFEAFVGVNFWTALFILLNTLVIFFVAKKFLFGPVMKIITDRQKEIDDLYADAGAAKENALAMQTEYQEKLAAAAQTSEQMVQEAVVRGQKREEAILLQANQQARAMLEKAPEMRIRYVPVGVVG